MACTPMSTPIAECVLDAVDVPEQFRDRAPRCGPGHPLRYTLAVAAEFCERLESDKQICRAAGTPDWKTLRRHPARSGGRPRQPPGGLRFCPARARAYADEPPNRVSEGTLNRGEEGDRERSTYTTGPLTEGLLVSLPRPIAARRKA